MSINSNIKKREMKKSYLMIAAAAMAMAACTNDNVLTDIQEGNESQKAITFSSFSEKLTKAGASTNLEAYHNTFAVYGTKTSSADASVQYVFGGKATASGDQNGVTCTYTASSDAQNGTGYWKYDNPRFWDKQATYDFIAYAPAASALKYFYNGAGVEIKNGGTFKTTESVILKGTNLQATATEAEIYAGFNNASGDLDLMTSALAEQDGTNHNTVNLVFKHILAKLNITFQKSYDLNNSVVTINDVKISGLFDKGDYDESAYAVNASGDAVTSGWTAASSDASYQLSYSDDNVVLNQVASGDATDPKYVIESLVMPQTISDDVMFVVKYTIKTGDYEENYTYKMKLNDAFANFMDRYNYTLKMKIAPSIIKFDATVSAWADKTVGPIEIE